MHKPVLLNETLDCLNLQPGMTVVDGTIGCGGHAAEILKRIGATGRLIGLDQDPLAVVRCQNKFCDVDRIILRCQNFRNIDQVLQALNIQWVDAVILDVGISSPQLETAERGFSFEREGPLDMRMNPEGHVRASDLINDLSQEKLEEIFRTFGEERWANRFANAIVIARQTAPILTTYDLVRVLEKGLPRGLKDRKDRHLIPTYSFATRVFQALRIAVNDELEALKSGLLNAWPRVNKGGRIAVIAFHSLEDRIVKNQFRLWVQAKEAKLVTKKPLVPLRDEVLDNRRARSAKLRTVEKL